MVESKVFKDIFFSKGANKTNFNLSILSEQESSEYIKGNIFSMLSLDDEKNYHYYEK